MKADGIVVEPGDVVVIEGTSGGGYGDPRERPRSAIEQDVADGLLSRERAASEYGMTFEPSGVDSADVVVEAGGP